MACLVGAALVVQLLSVAAAVVPVHVAAVALLRGVERAAVAGATEAARARGGTAVLLRLAPLAPVAEAVALRGARLSIVEETPSGAAGAVGAGTRAADLAFAVASGAHVCAAALLAGRQLATARAVACEVGPAIEVVGIFPGRHGGADALFPLDHAGHAASYAWLVAAEAFHAVGTSALGIVAALNNGSSVASLVLVVFCPTSQRQEQKKTWRDHL